jgi:tRNA-uridine 2-sulfurtransferase
MGFEQHLARPRGLGALAGGPHTGAAGGAACGDLVRVTVRVEGERIGQAGFDAEGCGAARAAGSAVVELVEGRMFLEAARVTPDDVADALGGLVPPKRHAAELAADALHRALGAAAKDAPSSRSAAAARAAESASGAPPAMDAALALPPSPRRTLVAMRWSRSRSSCGRTPPPMASAPAARPRPSPARGRWRIAWASRT